MNEEIIMTTVTDKKPIEKLFKEIRSLSIFCLLFSWIFIAPNRWNVGIILTIFSVLSYLFARRNAFKVKRAYLYHLYVFLAIFPFTLLSVAASLWLLDKANISIPNYTSLILGFVVLTFLSAFWLFQSMFLKSKEANIESGRLNANSGKWDLNSPLQHSPKQRNTLQTSAGCLSPLVIALAFYLARNLEGGAEIFLRGSGVFFFGFILMIGYAVYQLSVVSVLLSWEKEIGKQINLSTF